MSILGLRCNLDLLKIINPCNVHFVTFLFEVLNLFLCLMVSELIILFDLIFTNRRMPTKPDLFAPLESGRNIYNRELFIHQSASITNLAKKKRTFGPLSYFSMSKIYWSFIEIKNSSTEAVFMTLFEINSMASTEFMSLRKFRRM